MSNGTSKRNDKAQYAHTAAVELHASSNAAVEPKVSSISKKNAANGRAKPQVYHTSTPREYVDTGMDANQAPITVYRPFRRNDSGNATSSSFIAKSPIMEELRRMKTGFKIELEKFER